MTPDVELHDVPFDAPPELASTRTWTAMGWVIAAIASAVFAYSFGFSFGISNQTTYILGAIRGAHPGTLDSDWFTAHTTHYHPVFTYLATILLELDPSGWLIGITEVLAAFVVALITYWTVSLLSGRRLAPAVFLLLMTIMYVSRTKGTASSYLIGGLLQPSSIGNLGLIAALPLFLRARYLASGICLAVGGLFHANFLLLGFPVFGATHLLMGWRELWPRLLRQLGPSLVVFLLLAPVIFASVGSADGAEARELFLHMRSPHHFVPAAFEQAFTAFVGWQALALGSSLWLFADGRPETHRFGAFIASVLGVLWTGTALTTATYVPAVAQLFVWRLAPFADMWCQLLVCYAVVLGLAEPAGMRKRFSDVALALSLAGLGFLFMFYGVHSNEKFISLLNALTAGFVLAWALFGLGGLPLKWPAAWSARITPGSRTRWAYGQLAVLTLVAAAFFHHHTRDFVQASRSNSFLLKKALTEGDLYRWMREKTDLKARFLTPPEIDLFRVWGRRAIVVDWKSVPMRPPEFMEWRQRIAEVSGIAPAQLKSERNLGGYNGLDQARLDRLQKKYDFDYVIVRRGREQGLAGSVAFKNREFTVLKLR